MGCGGAGACRYYPRPCAGAGWAVACACGGAGWAAACVSPAALGLRGFRAEQLWRQGEVARRCGLESHFYH